jgi:hypothetical protein
MRLTYYHMQHMFRSQIYRVFAAAHGMHAHL